MIRIDEKLPNSLWIFTIFSKNDPKFQKSVAMATKI